MKIIDEIKEKRDRGELTDAYLFCLEVKIALQIKQAKQEVKDKNSVFVNHVHNHFKKEHPNWKVICKICGKDIDEIYEQEKKQSEKKRSS